MFACHAVMPRSGANHFPFDALHARPISSVRCAVLAHYYAGLNTTMTRSKVHQTNDWHV